MPTKPMILVTSAAGKTGLQTVLQLRKKGFPVRAFVRVDDQRAALMKDAGAEIFVGDLFSVTDMRRAMDGVQRAYHCSPTAPNGLHFGAVFAIAARESRLEHIVMLGQWLSDPGHPSMYTREVWLNEEIVKLLPETSLTVINVGWFADNYFMVLEPMAQLGVFPMPLGDGDVKKNAPPANEDIAAACVAALIDPEKHAGKTYRPTGPALLSPNDIAAIMTRVLARKVTYQDISESMLMKALKVGGYPEAMPTQLRIYCDEYRRGAFAVHAPNDVMQELTGRPAEDFESIARRMAATRPEAVQNIANKIKAIRNFAQILTSRTIDPEALECRRDHVLLASPKFAQDSNNWRTTHDPDAGFRAGEDGSAINPVRFNQRKTA